MRLPEEPVRQTCPQINQIIDTFTQMAKDMDSCNSDDSLENILDMISDWKWEVNNLIGGRNSEMEDLRASNSALRDWGHTLYGIAEGLQNELSNTEDKLSAALRERDDFENTIENLEEQLNSLGNV